MPGLYILIFLGVLILWFLCSFVFFPLGRFISRIINDAKREIERKE